MIFGADNYTSFGTKIEVGHISSINNLELVISEGETDLPFVQQNAHNIFILNQPTLQIDSLDMNLIPPTTEFQAELGINSYFNQFFLLKDLDNNFLDDIIISDIYNENYKGKTYIYLAQFFLSQILLSNQTANFIILGAKPENYMSIKKIIDLNNDGFLDVVISVPGYDSPYYGSGATMIVWGSATGFDNDPIANAGEDFSGFVDSLVTLDGTKSYDIDGDTLSFLWTQISGTQVTLQTPTQPLCSFLNSGLVGEFLTFVLEVSSNTFVAFDTVKVEVLPTGLSENTNKAQNFKLSQNFPNPFNPNTKIVYELPNKAGKLLIFNVKGEKVCEILLEKKSGSVVWNGTDFSGKQVSSGIYFYRLETENGFSETKKMVLLK